MNLPKVETVNVVTMQHGEDFAEAWFEGTLEDACDKTDILTWNEFDADQQKSFRILTGDICGRVSKR